MSEVPADLLGAVCEIRDLLRLMAEPAVAERDKKLRTELRRIVGSSAPRAKAVFLMDGSRSQSAIVKDCGVNAGHLSTLVKHLDAAKLLSGDPKKPKLAISIPKNFFDAGADDER